MDYFFDTCIKIGYVFCTDLWHDNAITVFDGNDSLHDSYCVNKEFNKKYNQLLRQQIKFFYSLKNELKSDKLNKNISLKDLKVKSLKIELNEDFDKVKKEKCVELLWKFCENKHCFDKKLNITVCNINDLVNNIYRFTKSFERTIRKRRMNFEREVICYPKREETYENLKIKLNDAGIHFPDNHILLDAHNLSLKENIKLDFITSDTKMINQIENMSDILSIRKFHHLKEFIKNKH